MYRCTNVWVYMCVSVQVYGCTRAGDWVDYPTYYRKTLSLDESITIHNPNLLAQLNYAATQTQWAWGYIEILSAHYGSR